MRDAQLERGDAGRDLASAPFQWLIRPAHFTNLDEPIFVLAFAHGAGTGTGGDVPLADAESGPHPFGLHEVREFHATLGTRPTYDIASDGGCICMTGAPWISTGSGACDSRIVPSFDALVGTAGCELAPGAPESLGSVCDGQNYFEATDRRLPCFAHRRDGACAVALRKCHDTDGVAYTDDCAPADDAPVLADDLLCAGYHAAAEPACGDVLGRLRAQLGAPQVVQCTLFADPMVRATDPQMPCAGQEWTASLPSPNACTAALLDGVDAPPFHLGLADAKGNAQPIGACPLTLLVESVEPMSAAELTVPHTVHLTVGDHPLDVVLTVVRQCAGPSGLVCQ
jgi:hypothetical protein